MIGDLCETYQQNMKSIIPTNAIHAMIKKLREVERYSKLTYWAEEVKEILIFRL